MSQVADALERHVRRDVGKELKNSLGHFEYEDLVEGMCDQLAAWIYKQYKDSEDG